jgi:hypothetical protein
MGLITFWSVLMLLIYWADINIMKKNTEALFGVSKEVCLEIHAEKRSMCSRLVVTLQDRIVL